jgi:hypothetical protein
MASNFPKKTERFPSFQAVQNHKNDLSLGNLSVQNLTGLTFFPAHKRYFTKQLEKPAPAQVGISTIAWQSASESTDPTELPCKDLVPSTEPKRV